MSSLILPREFLDQFKDESIWSTPAPLETPFRLEVCGRDDPIPRGPGVYQIFMVTKRGVYSFYIGMSGDLRERISALQGAFKGLMPYSDPHTAAPALYAWRHKRPEAVFLVAVVAFESSVYVRRAVEDFAIAHERWKRKRSPFAQFSRMPKRWRSSSGNNRRLILLGKRYRGGPTRQREQSHIEGIPPKTDLYTDATDPLGLDWAGYRWSLWSDPRTMPPLGKVEGLYRLRKQGQDGLDLIGCGQIQGAAEKARKLSPLMRISVVTGNWHAHQLQEQVSDLIGLYVQQKQSIPLLQYGGETSARPRDLLPFWPLVETILPLFSVRGVALPDIGAELLRVLLPVG